MSEEKYKPTLWEIAKSASAILITLVICIKAFMTPLSLSLDAPTLISLLLALFSIWLSSLFYFKATDTSNTFYDNTYKFTRDIAQLLSKMESGFGERLRHLDEGYSSMQSYLRTNGREGPREEVEKTKQKLEEERHDLKRTAEERNRIVRDLIERSQLQEGEKERIISQLRDKEKELEKSQQEVSKLNRRLMMDRVRSHRAASSEFISGDQGVDRFTALHVVEKIGRERILHSPRALIKQYFDKMSGDLPRGYIEDLERLELFENGLTDMGVEFLRGLARRESA